MRNGHNGGDLGQARRFYAAAEKAWGAVVQATNALLQKRGRKPGVGTGRKQDALTELEGHDPRLRAAALSQRYSQALLRLHARCFYDGDYNLDMVGREIRRVGQYIHSIARL